MKLILTSQGLQTKTGYNLIKDKIKKENLSKDKVLVLSEARYGMNQLLTNRLVNIGFMNKNIFNVDGTLSYSLPDKCQYIYVGEGNTFALLKIIKDNGLYDYIRDNVMNGAIYIGASAGAMICSTDICAAEDFEDNICGLRDYTGFSFVNGLIVPHYNKKEFIRYCKNSSKDFLDKYSEKYYITQTGCLQIEGRVN